MEELSITRFTSGIDNGSSDSKFVALSHDNPYDEDGIKGGNYFHKIPMFVFQITKEEYEKHSIEYAIRVKETNIKKNTSSQYSYYKLGKQAYSTGIDWGDYARKYQDKQVHIMTLFQIAFFVMKMESDLVWEGSSQLKQANVKLGATYNSNYNGDVAWMQHVFLGGASDVQRDYRQASDYIYTVSIKHYDVEFTKGYSYQLNIKFDKIVCLREPEAGFRGLILRKVKLAELAIEKEKMATEPEEQRYWKQVANSCKEILNKIKNGRGYLLDIGSSTLEFWEANQGQISSSARIVNWGVSHIARELHGYLLNNSKSKGQIISDDDVSSALMDHALPSSKKLLLQKSALVTDTVKFFKDRISPVLRSHLLGKNIEAGRYFYYYGGGGTLLANEIADFVRNNSHVSATPIFEIDKLEYANAYGIAAMVFWG